MMTFLHEPKTKIKIVMIAGYRRIRKHEFMSAFVSIASPMRMTVGEGILECV